MFKSIITSAAVFAVSMVAAPSVQAQSMNCYGYGSYARCNSSDGWSGRSNVFGNTRRTTITGPNGYSQTCRETYIGNSYRQNCY